MSELNFGRILRRTAMFANQPAVTDSGKRYDATYGQHLERVAKICSGLAGLGVNPHERVAILANNSHHYIELWHALLAGTAIINPINNRLALKEIEYILNDSGSSVLIVDSAFSNVAREMSRHVPGLRFVIQFDEDADACDYRLEDLITGSNSDTLPPEPDERAPAALIYTGGTTGLAKGVLLNQKAIALSIYRMLMQIRASNTGSYLACMPLFHIGGMGAWGSFLPYGYHTIVLPHFDPKLVNRAIQNWQITTIGLAPTMLAMLLQDADFSAPMLNSLERVLYGAAPMPAKLLDKLLGLYPELQFIQAYGMTECASIVTLLLPGDHTARSERLRSVGRPCIGVDIKIRGPEDARPCALGESGEIWVSTDSSLIEYWRKPEQTADSLVDGWYRTGDAGYVDEKGYLFLVDRIKDMIITGGENVYSLEVENTLRSHPSVNDVAVIGVPDDTWGEIVFAVVVSDRDPKPNPKTLDRYVRSKLAAFKAPKGYAVRSEPLPITAMGKVKKGVLRAEIDRIQQKKTRNE